MRVILLSTGVLMWASLCLSFGFYRSKIPNGYNVPDPCHEGKMWDRVGHVDREDGGRRNRFGRDFQSAGFVSIADDKLRINNKIFTGKDLYKHLCFRSNPLHITMYVCCISFVFIE